MNYKSKLFQFKTNCVNVADVLHSELTKLENQLVYFGNTENYTSKREFCGTLLSKEEIERMKKFAFDDDRLTYCISHGCLRICLSEFTNMSNEELKIEYHSNTKPHLINSNLDFNISHSKNYFAFAVAEKSGSIIGVDIEKLNNLKDYKSIIRDFMHEEEKTYILDDLISNEEQISRFYEIWTRKEAFLKMLGAGIIMNLPDINVVPGEKTIAVAIPENINVINIETQIYTKLTSDFVLSVSTNYNYTPDFIEINF